MCSLNKKYSKLKFTGWKIVVEHVRTGSYYSPAMGCLYPMKGNVPTITKQKQLNTYYRDDILDPDTSCYRSTMIGRTAAFVHKCDARLNYQTLTRYNNNHRLRIKVVKVILTGDLMIGYYGQIEPVVAGTHIEFLE